MHRAQRGLVSRNCLLAEKAGNCYKQKRTCHQNGDKTCAALKVLNSGKWSGVNDLEGVLDEAFFDMTRHTEYSRRCKARNGFLRFTYVLLWTPA